MKLDDKERFIRFFDEKRFLVVIEILEEDLFKNEVNFLECDFECDNSINDYKNKDILIFQFPKFNKKIKSKCVYNIGKILKVKPKYLLNIRTQLIYIMKLV